MSDTTRLASGLSAAFAVLAILLVTIPWEKNVVRPAKPFEKIRGSFWSPNRSPGRAEDQHLPQYDRLTQYIPVNEEEKVEAWVFLPSEETRRRASPSLLTLDSRPPVLLLGPGFGDRIGERVAKYAAGFAQAGIATVAFDYRTFGGSDGVPRHWVSPTRHLEDWEGVLRYVQTTHLNGTVDGSRVALWGTSYAGAHVLVTAAKEGTGVKAVISQIPFLSGSDALRQRLSPKALLHTVRLLGAAVADWLRSKLGLSPLYVQILGKNGELSILTVDDGEWWAQFPNVQLDDPGNLLLARFALEGPFYNPDKTIPHIKVPVMFVIATQDDICPADHVRQAARSLGPLATVVEKDTTHFGMDTHVQDLVPMEVAFLSQHLKVEEEEQQQ